MSGEKAEKLIRKLGNARKGIDLEFPGLKASAVASASVAALINSLLSGIFEFARAREPNVSDCTNCRCAIDIV